MPISQRWIISLGVIAFVCASTTGMAQQLVSSTQGVSPPKASQAEDSAKDVRERLITVSLRNVALEQALQAVAKAAQARLTYLADSGAPQPRVSLQGKNISVQASLQRLLRNTGMRAVIVAPNEIVITKSNIKTVRDSATIQGRVIDSATSAPISNAIITIGGENKALTNEAGTFVIQNLAAGQYVVFVRRLGYTSTRHTVTLTDGQDATIVLSLAARPNMLAEVVTTGSGERTKMEVGNSIATVNVDSLMQVTPVATVSDLLKNRIPGLQAIPGSGAVGAPTRLRIRGINSIESDNSPIIIVDGIRISNASMTDVNNAFYAGVTGGTYSPKQAANDLSSRLDDIDPHSIASIEVMKGPAASTLYGSDAANGVIIIKTKRGQAGPARWSIYLNHTSLVQPKEYDYPEQALGYPLRGAAPLRIPCSLADLHVGRCVPVPGQTVGFNMLEDARFTPQATGHNQTIGANVSGGVASLQYYFGATYLDQLGTAKLPNVNASWIVNARQGQRLSEEVLRPNARNNASGSTRLSGSFGGNSDFAIGATFTSQYQRVGHDGMATLMGGGLDIPRHPTDTAPLQGFNGWNATRSQRIKHTTASAQGNWRPVWGGQELFALSGTYGWDLAYTNDTYVAPRGSCEPLCVNASDPGVLGFINTGRQSDFTQTVNVGGVLTVPVTAWLQSQTRFGGNYVRNDVNNLYGQNNNLLPGPGSLYGASGTARVNEIGDWRGTIGWYLEQNLNARQTLYLTMGLRKDAGSALGKTVTPVYPKWNGSWILSQESFFPEAWRSAVPIVRVRAAYGRAGVMPSSTARLRSYYLQNRFTNDDGTTTGTFAVLDGAGNLVVRPERSAEHEGGIDLELLDARLTMGFTFFGKNTTDAIISTSTAPSLGVGGSLMLNVGDVRNRGTEFEASLRVLDRDNVSYSINANVATSHNTLVRIDRGSSVTINCGLNCGGNASVLAEGYPLFGRWAYPIVGWRDVNGNGFINPDEVKLSDSLAYIGPSTPTRTMYVGHTIGVLQNRVTLRANFAYTGGLTQFNDARKRSATYRAVIDGPNTLSLRDQACLVVAAVEYTNERATDWCYMETIKLWRLQDVSISTTIPASLTRFVRANAATLTVSGTNLRLWTNYHGVDPLVNTAPVTGNETVAGPAFAAPRSYGVRIQLTY